MSKFKNEFVDNAIDTNGPAGELELGIGRIVKDEIVLVKVSELCTTNSTRHLDSGQPHERQSR